LPQAASSRAAPPPRADRLLSRGPAARRSRRPRGSRHRAVRAVRHPRGGRGRPRVPRAPLCGHGCRLAPDRAGRQGHSLRRGDAGYGKTEVALRAAFKAVQDGKQVAIVVPTTVLAQQHYETFAERLATFPVRVEMLSRFRSPTEQREVALGLGTGEVDIVVGT